MLRTSDTVGGDLTHSEGPKSQSVSPSVSPFNVVIYDINQSFDTVDTLFQSITLTYAPTRNSSRAHAHMRGLGDTDCVNCVRTHPAPSVGGLKVTQLLFSECVTPGGVCQMLQIECAEVIRDGQTHHRATWRCPVCDRRTFIERPGFLALMLDVQANRKDRRCSKCRPQRKQQLDLLGDA